MKDCPPQEQILSEPSVPVLETDPEKASIDFAEILRTMWSGRPTIVRATVIAFLLATAVAFLLPAQYTSDAAFIPPNLGGNASLAGAIAGQLATFGAGDFLGGGGKSSGDVYAGVLKSRSVAESIVKRFDLIRQFKVKKESQAEKLLSASVAVNVDSKSSIVTLSVTQKSPALAHDIAEAYMDALRSTEGRLALSQSSQRRLFFGEQLAKEKDDLENAEVDLKKTEESSGLIAPSGQTESEIRTIAATRAQIASRQVALAALKQSSTDENPQMIRLRSEIADLQGQLQRLERGSGSGGVSAISASQVPELQLEYVRKEREVKYHEALFDMLSKQYESARLDESRDSPVLQILDPPSYPDSRSGPKRLYIMLGGLFLGFLMASLWVLTREAVLGTIGTLRRGHYD